MLPFELPLFEDFFFWPLMPGLFTFELSKIAGPFENCFLTELCFYDAAELLVD